jgi:hypothetical protein
MRGQTSAFARPAPALPDARKIAGKDLDPITHGRRLILGFPTLYFSIDIDSTAAPSLEPTANTGRNTSVSEQFCTQIPKLEHSQITGLRKVRGTSKLNERRHDWNLGYFIS